MATSSIGYRNSSYNRIATSNHNHYDDCDDDNFDLVVVDEADEQFDKVFRQTFTIGDDDDDDDENDIMMTNNADADYCVDDKVPLDDHFDLEHDDEEQPSPLNRTSSSSSTRKNRNNGINDNINNDNPNDRPPQNYRCPLTLQLMEDPVNDGCGHCFERRAILDWLEFNEMCPISRKPMDQNNLFHNGLLKARIQEWKEDHPFYQHMDADYRTHQREDMLSVSGHDSHSRFELMLLPQERHVLNIVKVRAQDRKKRQEFSRCMWALGITVTVFVVAATLLSLFLFELRVRGPV
jgi:hypothetical protein